MSSRKQIVRARGMGVGARHQEAFGEKKKMGGGADECRWRSAADLLPHSFVPLSLTGVQQVPLWFPGEAGEVIPSLVRKQARQCDLEGT